MDLGSLARGPGSPKGLVARCAPEAALLALALYGFGAMGAEPAAAATSAALGLLAYAGLKPGWRELLADLRFLGSLCLLLFLFQALRLEGPWPFLDPAGARAAGATCARIASTYAAARAFYAGMSVSRIRDGLERLARPFAPVLGGHGAAALALSLGFVPAVLGLWIETEEAARARAFRSQAGKVRGIRDSGRRMAALAALLAAFLRRLLLFAREVAEARATRGSGHARRSLPPLRLRATDALLVSASALPLLASLV